MIKQETKVIDGISFTTQQFAAMRGFTLLGKLVKVVGPALGALSGAGADTELSTMGPVIAGALSGLDPDAAAALALEILSGTVAQIDTDKGVRNVTLNTRENVDLVFMGKLRTMFNVLGFAISVNYQDFGVGSGAGLLAPATPTPSAA